MIYPVQTCTYLGPPVNSPILGDEHSASLLNSKRPPVSASSMQRQLISSPSHFSMNSMVAALPGLQSWRYTFRVSRASRIQTCRSKLLQIEQPSVVSETTEPPSSDVGSVTPTAQPRTIGLHVCLVLHEDVRISSSHRCRTFSLMLSTRRLRRHCLVFGGAFVERLSWRLSTRSV